MNAVSACCGIPNTVVPLNLISLPSFGDLPENLPEPAALAEAEAADRFPQLLAAWLAVPARQKDALEADIATANKPETQQLETQPLPSFPPLQVPMFVPAALPPGTSAPAQEHAAAAAQPLSVQETSASPFLLPSAVAGLMSAAVAFGPIAPGEAVDQPPESRIRPLSTEESVPERSEVPGASAKAASPESPRTGGRTSGFEIPHRFSPEPLPATEVPEFSAEPIHGDSSLPQPAATSTEVSRPPSPAADQFVAGGAPTKMNSAAAMKPEVPAALVLPSPWPVTDGPMPNAVAHPEEDSKVSREASPEPPAGTLAKMLSIQAAVRVAPAAEPPALPQPTSSASPEPPAVMLQNAGEPHSFGTNRIDRPASLEPQGDIAFVARVATEPGDTVESARLPPPKPNPPAAPGSPQIKDPQPFLAVSTRKAVLPEAPAPSRTPQAEAPDGSATSSPVSKHEGPQAHTPGLPAADAVSSLVRVTESPAPVSRPQSVTAVGSVMELVPEPPAAPVQRIVLRLPSEEFKTEAARPVDLVFRSNAGRLQLAVHSPDPQLAESMRGSLHELATQLEQRGFEAASWNSSGSSSSTADQPDSGGRRDSPMNPDRDDSRSRGRDQQEEPESPRRHADVWREQWMRSLFGDVSTPA